MGPSESPCTFCTDWWPTSKGKFSFCFHYRSVWTDPNSLHTWSTHHKPPDENILRITQLSLPSTFKNMYFRSPKYLFVFVYLQSLTVSEVGSQHATKAVVTQRRAIYLSDVKTDCRRRQPAALTVGRDTVLCRIWRIRSNASYAILSTLTFLDYTPWATGFRTLSLTSVTTGRTSGGKRRTAGRTCPFR